MKKIVFICPYFGKLPENHMSLWLQSCEKNQSINWIIFTDDKTRYNYPKNVLVNYVSLNELKNSIQKKFDFPISLDNGYKLCDYKPTYGYIFSEYIKGYDFWGYCDMSDCIFGDIRHFITDKILDKFDKIGFLGHLTLYRNTVEINKRFMLGTKSNITYRDILSSSENMAFDELNSYSINSIYKENGIPFYRMDDCYYDISPLTYAFRQSIYDENYEHKFLKKIPTIFKWENGKLFECYVYKNKLMEKELLYVHFQKRKMQKEFKEVENVYYIIPNKFIANNKDLYNIKQIRKISRFKFYSQFFKLKYKALKYRINMLHKRK